MRTRDQKGEIEQQKQKRRKGTPKIETDEKEHPRSK